MNSRTNDEPNGSMYALRAIHLLIGVTTIIPFVTAIFYVYAKVTPTLVGSGDILYTFSPMAIAISLGLLIYAVTMMSLYTAVSQFIFKKAITHFTEYEPPTTEPAA